MLLLLLTSVRTPNFVKVNVVIYGIITHTNYMQANQQRNTLKFQSYRLG